MHDFCYLSCLVSSKLLSAKCPVVDLVNSYLFLIVNNMAPFNVTLINTFSCNDLPQPQAYRPIDNSSAAYFVII